MGIRLKKATKLGSLLVVLGLAYISIFTIHPSTEKQNSEEKSLLNLSSLFQKLGFCSFNLENDEKFQQHIQEITTQKLKDDPTNSLHFLQSNYLPSTKVMAPEYLFQTDKESKKKPKIQPFDPRFTLSIYLEWIRENPGKPVPFHWSDWVDLSLLYKYILSPQKSKESCQGLFELKEVQKKKSTTLPVDEYCTNVLDFPLGFKVTKFPEAHTRQSAKLLAKSYIYSSFPAPSRLVFLTTSHGTYHVEIENPENNLKYSLLENNMPELILKSKDLRQLDLLEAYNSLISLQPPTVGYQEDPPEINLDASWFDVDINATILDLGQKEQSSQEANYLSSLKFLTNTKSPEKSFMEAKLLTSDPKSLLVSHYDWRFFDGFTMDTERHALSLNRILKTYLHFCRSHDLITWIAHGSLLSWYWNGMVFPWDTDIDVQMPLRDLHRLARDFNQSMVIENVGHDIPGSADSKFSGMGTFFIDVGSSISHRDHGNGFNNIDARFIDIHTGLYVDITGLAVSNERAPARYMRSHPIKSNTQDNKVRNKSDGLFNCRNKHFSSLEELTPLVKTVVQNEVGYIPADFRSILKTEYSNVGLKATKFKDYYYLKWLRLWVKSEVLLDYIKDPNTWINNNQGRDQRTYEAKIDDITKLTEDDVKNLLFHTPILSEYSRSRDFTLFHQNQMQNLLSSKMRRYFSNLKTYLSKDQLWRPLSEDLFMNKIVTQGLDYEEEVRKVIALGSIYEKEEGK